jgi:hypothetical protein
MRRARHLLWTLAFAALAAAPVHATSVTVLMSGTWFNVIDNANVSGGSIAVGTPFTVTLTYDDAVADSNADPTIGDYVIPGASAALALATGGFTFSLVSTESLLLGVGNNTLAGEDDLLYFAQNFTTSGPLPGGITTGLANSSMLLVDSSQTAHSSDSLTGIPWSVAAYDSPNQGMYFLIQVLGAGANKKIELFGEFTSFAVLPEPSLLAVLVLASLPGIARIRG